MPKVALGAAALYSASLMPSERDVRRLFWREDMENYALTKWTPYYPAGVAVAYVNGVIPAFEGDYVLQVTPPVRYAEMAVYFGCFKLQKTAFEMRWYKRSGDLRNGYVGQVRCDHLGNALKGTIRWSPNLRNDGNPGWTYRVDDAGTPADVPGGREAIVNDTWNYLKIVVDWRKGVFDRLVTNYLDLDLSSIPLHVPAGETAGQYRIMIGFEALPDVAIGYPFYIDDTRLYLNEV